MDIDTIHLDKKQKREREICFKFLFVLLCFVFGKGGEKQ